MQLNLLVNLGHDLNLRNLPPLIERVSDLNEASIGHELTVDALMMGFPAAVHAYTKPRSKRQLKPACGSGTARLAANQALRSSQASDFTARIYLIYLHRYDPMVHP